MAICLGCYQGWRSNCSRFCSVSFRTSSSWMEAWETWELGISRKKCHLTCVRCNGSWFEPCCDSRATEAHLRLSPSFFSLLYQERERRENRQHMNLTNNAEKSNEAGRVGDFCSFPVLLAPHFAVNWSSSSFCSILSFTPHFPRNCNVFCFISFTVPKMIQGVLRGAAAQGAAGRSPARRHLGGGSSLQPLPDAPQREAG